LHWSPQPFVCLHHVKPRLKVTFTARPTTAIFMARISEMELESGTGLASPCHSYVPPSQELCDSNPSFISRGQVTAPQSQVIPNASKKKTPVAKKSVTKVSVPKAKPGKKIAAK
jgi:hypothetical protein